MRKENTMSKKHPRRQLPAFDSVRIGTKRRVHPALPSAVPRGPQEHTRVR
jgi:hypothetical protein